MHVSNQTIFAILSQCDFSDLSANTFREKIANKVNTIGTGLRMRDLSFANGATKGVILIRDWDFVIKIPFHRGRSGHYLCGASNGVREWDYCLTEEHIYEHATNRGVDEFFAQTFCIGRVRHHPIYLQERVHQLSSESYYDMDFPRKIRRQGDAIGNHFSTDIPYDAISGMIAESTYAQVYNLYCFMCDDEYRIGDMHDENYGVRHGRFVLLDYSGFRG